MNLLREKARALGHHRAMGGGDSSSTSSQSTNYNMTDSRSVSSVDSHDNYSQDNRIDSRQWNDSSTNTTTINALDGGAVAAGTSVSLEALKNNATSTGALLAVADSLFSKNVDLVKANLALTATLSDKAADAYQGATEEANGNKTLVQAGLVVVAVVAVMAFGKN